MTEHELVKAEISDLPVLLTIREAATVLRLPRSHVYKLVAEGILPKVSFGRAIRIHRQAIASILAQGVPKSD